MRYTEDEIDALRELSDTQGWQVLHRWVQAQKEAATRSLIDTAPTDAAKIAALQAEIRCIGRVFDHVRHTLAQTDKE